MVQGHSAAHYDSLKKKSWSYYKKSLSSRIQDWISVKVCISIICTLNVQVKMEKLGRILLVFFDNFNIVSYQTHIHTYLVMFISF